MARIRRSIVAISLPGALVGLWGMAPPAWAIPAMPPGVGWRLGVVAACPLHATPGDPIARVPHPAPPPANVVTIEQVQNRDAEGRVEENTQVEIAGVVVTGVAPRGFWVQTPGKTEWNGLYVFRQQDDAFVLPARGDVVTVTGTYVEYWGLTQIIGSAVTVTGPDGVSASEGMTRTVTVAATGMTRCLLRRERRCR